MALISAIFSILLMACVAFARLRPIYSGCHPSSPSVKTLTYTPWMAPQVAPISTIYRTIVTHWDYIVYCSNGAATVTNVQANPPAIGPFTSQTIVPTLTVEAVQCMPSDRVITRREFRGMDYVERTATKKIFDDAVPTSVENPKFTSVLRNPFMETIPFRIPKAWKRSARADEIHKLAKRQTIPTTLSPQAAALVSQIQTAEYALELCNSDFNLTEICKELRQPEAIAPLANVGVSASQAGDIVCFAAVYGLDLNTTNAELLGDLAAAVYGLELGDNFTNTSNTTRLCNNIDFAAAPYLGIDADAVNNFICGGPSSSITVTAITTQTVIVVPGNPTYTITASSIATAASTVTMTSGSPVTSGNPWSSGIGTGGSLGWPNGTMTWLTSGGGGGPASGGSSVTGASGTGAGNAWGNTTIVDSLGIEFHSTSQNAHKAKGNTPVPVDWPQFYPASASETSTSVTFGRYI